MAKYRFKTMRDELSSLTARIEMGEDLSVFEQKYAVALEHAMKLSQYARSNEFNERVRLDFTMETEQKLDKALSLLGMKKMQEGSSEDECIEYLADICSYYQLFALCNYIEEYSDRAIREVPLTAIIGYDAKLSDNLILKSNNQSGVEIVFDPRKSLQNVIDKCIFFVENEIADNKRSLVVGLDRYRDQVIKGYLSEIEK